MDYGDHGPVIREGQPAALRVTIRNTYKTQANLSLHWYLPEGWRVSPAADGYALSLPAHMGEPLRIDFSFTADRIARATSRAALEITIEGRPTVMLVPALWLNGNLMAES